VTSIYQLSASELTKKIKSKEISSLELTQTYIDRIEKYDDSINAVVVRIFDKALEDAIKADKALENGEYWGPLHGLPMTIKESYKIKGTKATWGNEAYRNNMADSDGLAVQRFKNAGAHFLGKTNVPLDLADFQSYNTIYGQTNNPWDVSKIPGGSSGGSAAALAAGFTGLEAGSDIGGSIRNPAHYCGVYGHKPTHAIIPSSGHELVPNVPEPDLSVCGPLARSAEDLGLALDVMSGPFGEEAVGWKLQLPEPQFKDLKDLKVAIWATDEMAPVASEISERALMVGEKLASLGATVSLDARPSFDTLHQEIVYQTLLQSVMSVSMPKDEIEKVQEIVNNLEPEDMSAEALLARGSVLSHRNWIRTNYQREQIKIAWSEFFSEWDILICPQQATTAFPHDHRKFSERKTIVDNQEQPYFQQIFWAGMIVNAHLPSTVFPTGPSNEGLPIGLQAVSGLYQDKKTIKFCELLSKEIRGFTPPPDYE
jgi:amidase